MATKFEDLPIKQFISKLKALGDYTLSAQADSLTFYFGIDLDGKFYTSQYSPNKRTKFCYKLSDYQLTVENNPFRAAHKAISSFASEITDILEPGQVIETQLEANAQSSLGNEFNKIVLVRPVVGEQSLADKGVIESIASKIANKKVVVKVKQLSSVDGQDLQVMDDISNWKVVKSKTIAGSKLTSSKLTSILHKLEDFLKQPNEKVKQKTGLEMSNMEVAAANLTQVKMDFRDVVSAERDALNDKILTKYKFPIKTEILTSIEDEVGEKAGLLHRGSEGIWIASNEFSSIARFDTIPKRELSGMMRTTDKKASIEDRGGLEGVFQQRIADLLGIPELMRFQSAKKVFSSFMKENPRATAYAFASQFKQLDFYGIRTKVLAVLSYSKDEAQKRLDKFKQTSSDFKIVTDGETITYSAADVKANLAYFAQAIKGYEERISDIKKSKAFGDMILALYEPIIYALHGQHLNEAHLDFVAEAKHNSFDILHGMDAHDICSAYTATLLASQLLLRTKNRTAGHMLSDSAHASLKTYSTSISPLNFWGLMVFSPFVASVKGKLQPQVSADLKKKAGRVIVQRIIATHRPLSTGNFVQDWDQQEQSASIIAMRLETRGQAINMTIAGIRNWDDITLSDKNTILAKIFYYLQQYVPSSPLLPLIRQLANDTLTHANKENNLKKDSLSDIQKEGMDFSQFLDEDSMSFTPMTNAIASTGNISGTFADLGQAGDPTASNSDMKFKGYKQKDDNSNHLLVKYMNGKPIIRRKRDFVKRPKFERFPGTKKIQEDEGGGDAGDVSTATTSGAIATYPTPLFANKKGKTGKRMLKRIIPGYTHVKSGLDKLFKDLTESNVGYIELDWTDEEWSGDATSDEGFKYLREAYGISAEVCHTGAEKRRWPLVKLSGNIDSIAKFLREEYKQTELISTIKKRPGVL